MNRTKRLLTWATPLLASCLLAVACGDDTSDSAEPDGSTQGGDPSGSIVVSGSSTVEPISVAVSEAFQGEHPGVEVSVDGPGTGDGFELFCNGETDVNDASSKISGEQIEACEANGIEFVELQIGIDGLSIVTNEANDAVTSPHAGRPLRADRPGVAGLHQLGRRAGPGRRTGLGNRASRCSAGDHRPRRGVRHVLELRRVGDQGASTRTAGPTPPPVPTTRPRRTTT
ncbi:MAG: substrate-binding domain-containing protein [Microthrixaceae bacterium]|nr:substrate-binding domain-containing protein [Microthrixaceae bacterium]